MTLNTEALLKSLDIVRIVLVGFMGAGKTTVGRLLAKRLGCAFVDLDDEIVARWGRSIPQIFRESGEAGFREAEREALREVVGRQDTMKPVVLAVGGGAFVQANAETLRKHGFTAVFLDAPVEELRRRCAGAAGARPLYPDENQFRQLYEQRRRGYMTAGVRVDTAGKDPAQVAAEVAATLGVRNP